MNSYRLPQLFILCLISLLFVASGCSSKSTQADPVEIYVMTAASMTNAMNDLKEMYEAENEHVQIIPNFGSSGQLKTQIDQGAPADLFLSAAVRWMDELDAEKQLTEKSDFLRNELVLIKHKDSKVTLQDLEGLKDESIHNLSIGLPETVPAGEYAKQVLEHTGLYSDVEPKIIFASDVRQVLTYVQTGNVDVGLVYKTDAILTDDVKIILTVDHSLHDEILYPIGLLASSQEKEEAKKFYDWLLTKTAVEVFEQYGFTGVHND